MNTALLLDMLAGILTELDARATKDVELKVETNQFGGLEVAGATVSRQGDGTWGVSYYEEVSACLAHGLDPVVELGLTR